MTAVNIMRNWTYKKQNKDIRGDYLRYQMANFQDNIHWHYDNIEILLIAFSEMSDCFSLWMKWYYKASKAFDFGWVDMSLDYVLITE